jgi:hypothetical protein
VDLVRGLLVALAIGGWAVSASKLRSLRRDPSNLALRHLCIAQLALTLAVTLQPMAASVDRTLGILDLSRVTANCLTLLAATSGLAFGVHASSPAHTARPFVRRQLAAMWICLAAIVTLAAWHRPPYGVSDPHVASGAHYDATPSLGLVPYTPIFLGYLAWVLFQVGRVAHRNRAISGAGPPLVALGVRTITAGAAIGIAYTVAKAAGVAAATWAEPSPPLDAAVAGLFSAAIIAILVGVTLPAWGGHVGADRLYERFTAWRSCRQLRPLWHLLVTASPQIALLPHPTPAPLRRVRLTIEILDGCALLTPWMTPAAAETAGRHADALRLGAHERAAAIEAAALATAAHRKLEGRPPATDPADGIPLAPPPGSRAGTAADQVAWLEQIAHTMRHSPALSATLHELGTAPTRR